MTVEEITQIIEQHPQMKYEELKNHALAGGLSLSNFNLAWDAHLRKHRKASKDQIYSIACMVLLGLIAIFGLEEGYWQFILNPPTAAFQGLAGKTGLIAGFFLLLHLASRLAGGQKSIFATVKLGVFLLIIGYLVHLTTYLNSNTVYIISMFGLAFLTMVTVYAIKGTYDLNILRTLIFIVLSGLSIVLLLYLTYGLPEFYSDYFKTKKPLSDPVTRVELIEGELIK